MAKICMVAFTQYRFDPRPRREAEALAARGDEVDFISLAENGSEHFEEINGVRLHELPNTRYRGGNSGSYLRAYLSFFFSAMFRLNALHLRNRFDVVQIHTLPDFMVFTAILPKIMGAKIILDVHDLMPEAYMAKFEKEKNSPIIQFVTLIERMSVKFSHRAIAVHAPHRETLAGHGNPIDKFSILLNLPDPNVIRRDAPPLVHKPGETLRLIYHGIVTQRNGLETAIRAAALASESAPVHLRIVGGGDDIPRLRDLASDLQLEKIVSFSGGYVPVDELLPIIQQAHIGLVTLIYDPMTRHMLPTKLLEYVSLGLPAVVARTETIQTYFDDDMVRFYTPGDEVELSRHIVDLYHHPEKRDMLVRNAARFTERYSWSRQKQEYYALIDSLLSNGGAIKARVAKV